MHEILNYDYIKQNQLSPQRNFVPPFAQDDGSILENNGPINDGMLPPINRGRSAQQLQSLNPDQAAGLRRGGGNGF